MVSPKLRLGPTSVQIDMIAGVTASETNLLLATPRATLIGRLFRPGTTETANRCKGRPAGKGRDDRAQSDGKCDGPTTAASVSYALQLSLVDKSGASFRTAVVPALICRFAVLDMTHRRSARTETAPGRQRAQPPSPDRQPSDQLLARCQSRGQKNRWPQRTQANRQSAR